MTYEKDGSSGRCGTARNDHSGPPCFTLGPSTVGTTLEITLNGQRREVPEPLTVAQLLGHLGLKPEHVAVEVNRDLVSRARHPETPVAPGDVWRSSRSSVAERQSPATELDVTPLTIGTHTVRSRLFVGTGKYPTLELMRECLEASGAEVVTVAVRRERLFDREGRNLLDYLDPSRYTILPNTAGCFSAEEALRTARLGRELLEGLGNPGADWVKLEVLADTRTLLPDPVATLEATRVLVKEGFQVLCYTSDDPVMARRLKEAGAASVMPAGSPIGSGQGVLNPNNIRIILEDLKAGDPVLSGDRRCRRGHGQRCGDRHGAGLRRRLAQHRHRRRGRPAAHGARHAAGGRGRLAGRRRRAHRPEALRDRLQPHPGHGGAKLRAFRACLSPAWTWPPENASDRMAQLDPASILGPGGAVARRLPAYELRDQQLEMAEAVARAIERPGSRDRRGRHRRGQELRLSRPRDPGRRRAEEEDRRLHAHDRASGTIAAQGHPVPAIGDAAGILGRAGEGPRQLHQPAPAGCRGGPRSRAPSSSRRNSTSLARSSSGPTGPTDGTRSDLDFRPLRSVWDAVQSENGNCLGRDCPRNKECFYFKARRRVWTANLLIVNHALFVTDLALRESRLRPASRVRRRHLRRGPHARGRGRRAHGAARSPTSASTITLARLYNDRTGKGLLAYHQASGGHGPGAVTAAWPPTTSSTTLPTGSSGKARLQRPGAPHRSTGLITFAKSSTSWPRPSVEGSARSRSRSTASS